MALPGEAAMPNGENVFDAQWEFDAPRFHDFEKGDPTDETIDDWFTTSATKGLATPEDTRQNSKDETVENQPAQQKRSSDDLENRSQPQAGQPAKKSDSAEAAQVRAVLAHITNNTARKDAPAETQAAVFKPASQEKGAVPKSQRKPPQQQQQEHVKKVDKAAVIAPPPAEPKPAAAAPAPVAKSAVPKEAAAAPSLPLTRAAVKPAPVPKKAAVPPAAAAPARPTAAPKPKQRGPPAPRITVARSPFLRSKQRSATHRQQSTKTSEELEMEAIERGRRDAAAMRRRNARAVGSTLQARPPAPVMPAPRPAKRTLAEAPKEPNLRTAKRQRMHGMETRSRGDDAGAAGPSAAAAAVAGFTTKGPSTMTLGAGGSKKRVQGERKPQQQRKGGRAQLTVPRTPRFATTSRSRPSRYKPTEEAEAELAAAQAAEMKRRHTKRKAPEPSSAETAAARPVRRARKAPTEFQPFSFATDVRAAQRPKTVAVEAPASFVFGVEGAVTRSRARNLGQGQAASDSNQRRQQQMRRIVGDVAAEEATAASPPPGAPLPGAAPSAAAAPSAGGGGFRIAPQRRTTAGRLGGAMRVLRQDAEDAEQAPGAGGEHQQVQGEERATAAEEVDGMRAIIRAGATGDDRTTLHNPLFHA